MTLLALPVAGASAATAADPSPSGSVPTVELIPAFDDDLPTGSAPLTLAGPESRSSDALSPAAAWVCSVYTSDPDKSGGEIHGVGSQICTGAGYAPIKIDVTIQRYTALGFWNNRYKAVGAWNSSNFDTLEAWYDCGGDGTQTYRIVTDASAMGGAYMQSVQSLNYLRVSC